MSASTYAYGWKGHILAPADECLDADRLNNVVPVPEEAWLKLLDVVESGDSAAGVRMEKLGLLCKGDVYYIATGTAFVEGYTNYGTVFGPAEDGALAVDEDTEYHQVMLEIYGITLPPSRFMIGCSTDDNIMIETYDASYAGNLLAIIHSDGGHYCGDHGWKKATDDAIGIVRGWRSELEKNQARVKSLCADWADDDTRVKEIAKTVGIDLEAEREASDDDSFPSVIEVVERMAAALTEVRAKYNRDMADMNARLITRSRDYMAKLDELNLQKK